MHTKTHLHTWTPSSSFSGILKEIHVQCFCIGKTKLKVRDLYANVCCKIVTMHYNIL